MKRWLAIAMLSVSAAASHVVSARADPVLGVAVKHGSRICLYLPAPAPPQRTKIMLVTMDTPQTLAQGEISAKAHDCLDVITPHMAGFSLKLRSGELADNAAAVAILLQAQAKIDDGHAVLTWNGAVTFRSCTSADGVHLTAWRGDTRLWHAYDYIGQDLEADCTDAESKP
jgi:hypothetical protein